MKFLTIVLCSVFVVLQPAFAWEYWENYDEFNGVFKRSCVYDHTLWEHSDTHVNLCFARSVKFEDIDLWIGLDDRDQFCSGEIRVVYKIDGGEVRSWNGELWPVTTPAGSMSFVVLDWDRKKIASLVQGNSILFRLHDSCNNILDLSFNVRGNPHSEVLR